MFLGPLADSPPQSKSDKNCKLCHSHCRLTNDVLPAINCTFYLPSLAFSLSHNCSQSFTGSFSLSLSLSYLSSALHSLFLFFSLFQSLFHLFLSFPFSLFFIFLFLFLPLPLSLFPFHFLDLSFPFCLSFFISLVLFFVFQWVLNWKEISEGKRWKKGPKQFHFKVCDKTQKNCTQKMNLEIFKRNEQPSSSQS